jgi:hypothetical protein
LFETKVIGILTLNHVNQFLESDIDLAATTISITSNYKVTDNEADDYFGDDEQWTLPTNI